MKHLFLQLLLALQLTGQVTPLLAAGLETEIGMYQSEIEAQIKNLISSQLAVGEYFVYAKVERLDNKKDSGGDGKGASRGELPFTGLEVDRSYLRSLFEKNNPSEIYQNLRVTVTLNFDERIPKKKREMIEAVIKDRFGFDGNQRILQTNTLSLVTPPIAMEKTLVFEKEKLESERAKLALEMERAKLELSKRELELAEKDRKAAETNAAATKAAEDEASKAAQPTAEGDKVSVPPSNPLKDYQLLVFGIIVALVILLGAVMGGGILKKGLTPLSASLGQVADGIKSGKPAQDGASAGGGHAQAVHAPAAVAPMTSENHGPSTVNVQHGTASELGNSSHEGDSTFEAFIESVQEKVDVLVREKNFGLYRQLSDMVEDDQHLPKAAALLVSLSDDSVRQLINGLSASQIGRIRNYLESEGAFATARSLRKAALQDFYSRIAMDEFMGSPLLQLKDLGWLVKMSNAEIAKTALSLSAKEQVSFLACLTPNRTKKVIASIDDEQNRSILIGRLADLNSVDGESILNTLNSISKRMLGAAAKKKDDGTGTAIDAAKYIAAVAEDLREEDQAKLWSSMPEGGDLLGRIREHFIPFSFVKNLPKALVLEIFSARSNKQIAQILFDSSADVQKFVIGTIPDIRASSIEDELNLLAQNQTYELRNRKISLEMQKEVAKYLLRMFKEGLFTLDDVKPVAGADHAA